MQQLKEPCRQSAEFVRSRPDRQTFQRVRKCQAADCCLALVILSQPTPAYTTQNWTISGHYYRNANHGKQNQWTQVLQQEAYPTIWCPADAQNLAIPGAIPPK